MKNLRILTVSSETTPFAKTGGLADVAGALSSALAKRGNEVTLLMPYYKEVKKKDLKVEETGISLEVVFSGRSEKASLLRHNLADGLNVYFIAHDRYYERDELYGDSTGDYQDNAERFIFFCRAVLAAGRLIGNKIDIVHCHDWQTGLIPLYIREERMDGGGFWKDTASVFTLHNIAYQGNFWHYDLDLTGLPWSYYTPEGIEFYGEISLLKAGLVYADKITTVSKRYAQEVQTGDFGYRLEGIISSRKKDLAGILNGVDYREWSPETDKLIRKNYSREDLSGKRECKRELMEIFSLESGRDRPIIGFISRLAQQKGVDILIEAVPEIVGLGASLVVLGKGEQHYGQQLRELAREFPGRVGVRITFDNDLAHKIEAGCDMFIMPSRYEPCGLNQMYSLRYGTVPIVKATGGLDDTIREFNPGTRKGNGFKFKGHELRNMLKKIGEAIDLYRNKKLWETVMRNGMEEDFSWDSSARKYERLYRKAQKELVNK
ncbi:MAG: glycogen synthase GlgA [Deltaproteobacteria bacterium]|nr:MAG: glycogen synthase GlgA [Deltaproteobacteria bacterium]